MNPLSAAGDRFVQAPRLERIQHSPAPPGGMPGCRTAPYPTNRRQHAIPRRAAVGSPAGPSSPRQSATRLVRKRESDWRTVERSQAVSRPPPVRRTKGLRFSTETARSASSPTGTRPGSAIPGSIQGARRLHADSTDPPRRLPRDEAMRESRGRRSLRILLRQAWRHRPGRTPAAWRRPASRRRPAAPALRHHLRVPDPRPLRCRLPPPISSR